MQKKTNWTNPTNWFCTCLLQQTVATENTSDTVVNGQWTEIDFITASLFVNGLRFHVDVDPFIEDEAAMLSCHQGLWNDFATPSENYF
jgi:hypothetical protein